MRKCIIESLDNSGNVVLNSYSNINSQTVLSKYVNDTMYDKLNLEKYIVEDIQSGNDTTIYFSGRENKSDQFMLSFQTELLHNDHMYPLVQKIREYLKEKNINELKRRKVRRENIHKGSVVISLVLLVSLLTSIAAHSKKKSENNSDIIMFESVIEIPESSNEFTTSITADEPSTEQKSDNLKVAYIDFSGFEPDKEKSINVDLNYASIIEKYAKEYEVNADVMIAIAKQERGFHSSTMDSGGATGLMQIQNSTWVGQELKARNKDGQLETVIVTAEDLGDIEKNIKYACMIMQNVKDYMDNNELLAIQCYNMGVGNMEKIFSACYECTGETEESIKNDPTNTTWLNYRNVVNAGDQYYLERILSYISNRKNTSDIKLESKGEKIIVSNSLEKVK